MYAATSQDVILATLLLDLAVMAACALALGALARRFGQAAVVGEIVAGLLLGPSVLGLLPGNLDALLFPADVRPYLQVLANVALVLFIFGVGFEVDVGRLRRSGRHAMRVAAASVLVPLVAAAAVAPALWKAHPPPITSTTSLQFGIFLGIALSVTALPVLARVLADAGLSHTSLGMLALVVAAMTDLVAWSALAGLTATLDASGSGLAPGALAAGLVGFAALLALVVRPLLRRGLAGSWCERHGPAGAGLLLLVALALSAAATTLLGLHPVFGAFALGVACPRHCRRASGSEPGEPAERVAGAASTLSSAGLLLVPLYFIVTGLSIDLTDIGATGALEVAGLLVVATAAKVAGVGITAARGGFDGARALGLGLLLNTRGLTELIVLDLGLRAGIIDDRLFAVLVLVAILTTAMTMPLLPRALRLGRGKADRAASRAYAAGLAG